MIIKFFLPLILFAVVACCFALLMSLLIWIIKLKKANSNHGFELHDRVFLTPFCDCGYIGKSATEMEQHFQDCSKYRIQILKQLKAK